MENNLKKEILSIAENCSKENKSTILSNDFFEQMLSHGVELSDELYDLILPYAEKYNCKLLFEKQYKLHRNLKIRKDYKVDDPHPVDLFEFRDYNFRTSGMYLIKWDGLYRYDDNLSIYKHVFPHPILIVDRFINITTGIYSVKLAFIDKGELKYKTCSSSEISNVRTILKLSDYGIRVDSLNSSYLVHFLSDFITVNEDIIPVKRSTNSLGWTNDGSFLPYTGNTIFEGDSYTNHFVDAFNATGNYEEWKCAINNSLKNDVFRMYIASSFASSLIKVMDSKSFLIHIWGNPGTGKSVALEAAMSIWGNPRILTFNWSSTLYAGENNLGALNNIPYALNESQLLRDENGKIKSPTKFIHLFTEEKSKPRGGGNLTNQIIKTWSNICLSNGEASISNELSQGGELDRVIEIHNNSFIFDKTGENKEAIAMSKFCAQNYGYAGREFIENINNYDYNKIFNMIIESLKDSGTGRQITCFSTILLGDYLMQRIIWGKNEHAALESTFRLMQRQKYNLKNTRDIDINIKAVDFIYEWIAGNRNRFISVDTEYIQIGETYGAISEAANTVKIISKYLNDAIVNSGYNVKKTMEYLFQLNLILENDDGRYTCKPYLAKGMGRPRCYVLKLNYD